MSNHLARAAAGIAGVEVPAAVRDAAMSNLRLWSTDPRFAAYVPQIEAAVDRGAFDDLVDAFYRVVPFGTGGRRGAVGIGPNRINPYTVSTSVQGHVQWLRERPSEGTASVVIAYDVRRFEDLGGATSSHRPSPVRGLSSRDLAELAARVYAANGVDVYLLPRGSTAWVSTPELSFLIRRLGSVGGLNLSASHNPPDDNGVKVYDHRGAQLVPPDDEALLDQVARVDAATELDWDAAVASGHLCWLTPEHHREYVQAVAAVVAPGPRTLPTLYTPLHGTGAVHEVLQAAGFHPALHAPQAIPDGLFPTVPGQVANPERPEAMAHAIAAAGDAQLVFGTDPDADRIGCEVRHGSGWVHLSGNDLGALVVHGQLQRDWQGRTPLVVTTEVTSTLVSRVAAAGGARVVDDLLVGFKYVAEVLRSLEEEGRYGDLAATDLVFVAGIEESHGVLVTDVMRDKDAAGAALVLADLAARLAEGGQTLVDALHALHREHGTVVNGQTSIRFEGATGQQRLAELLDRLRSQPPHRLAGRDVVRFVDHRDESGRFGSFRSESDRAGRNVLVLDLGPSVGDEGARVILRPSGTEPKLKAYVEVIGPRGLEPSQRSPIDGAFQALTAALAETVAS